LACQTILFGTYHANSDPNPFNCHFDVSTIVETWKYSLELFSSFIVVSVIGWRLPSLNEFLIWLTGIVVLLYTVETQGLRLEMVRQNEIAVQPLVIIGVHWKRFQNRLFLKNIGRGPALFVRIEDVALGEVAGDLADLRDRLVADVATFNQFNYVEVGEEVGFRGLCATDVTVGFENIDFLPSLDPDTAKQNYELLINYQDVDGRVHQTRMRVGKDGIALLGRH
jgi:hypothetical protein